MRSCSIYDCRIGHIVLTGDSFGMDVCCCIAETGASENPDCTYSVVKFLNMVDGSIHESGAVESAYLDVCYLISKISVGEAMKLKEFWSKK